MSAVKQPFGHTGERVVFISPEPVQHDDGEIPESDLDILLIEFLRVTSRDDIGGWTYAQAANALLDECSSKINMLSDDFTELPWLNLDQCDYFAHLIVKLARDTHTREFTETVEACLFPRPHDETAHDVAWAVLNS